MMSTATKSHDSSQDAKANPLPLEGVKVLDIATFVAAPFAAACLSEFGAEVIKIEQPAVGDSLRRLGTTTPHGDTYFWVSEARNKKCITLNLKTEQGAAIFKQLLLETDVLIENFRPGTLEKWGLGWETLHQLHPKLIMLRVSAYGQTGPRSSEPGFARIAQAFCGLTYLTGTPDTPPLTPGSNTLCDYLTGLYGAFGIMLALRACDKSGLGQYIDLGLHEGMFRFLDELAPVYQQTGKVRERKGSDAPHTVPHNHYQTADQQWIAIACTNDKMFSRLCVAMDKPQLAEPDQYGVWTKRLEHRQQVDKLVQEWLMQKTMQEALSILQANEVPCGPIHSIAGIFEDAQFKARQNIASVEDERFGKLAVPAVVPNLSGTPGKIRHLGASLGAHNEEIFGEKLGLTPEAIIALAKEGII